MTIWTKRLLPSLIKGYGAILIALIVASCEWGDRTITLVRPNTDNLQVIYTDTVTIARSTVMKDSLNTTTGHIITGIYEDDLLGVIRAKGYLAVSTFSSIGLQDRAVYDSLALNTKIVYTYGDTTQRYTLSIHELLQDITRGPYYNHRSSEYSTDPLGQVSFVPRPNLRDSLCIRLSDDLGEKLFEAARTNQLSNQESLLRYLKGFAFVGDYERKGGFLGFAKDSTKVTLYYHVDGPDGKVKYNVDISIGQIYNEIVNDRTGTPFQSLVTTRNPLSIDKTNGISVIQSGVGLMTRLDFPFLHNFGFDLGKVVINRAFLRVDLPRNPQVPYMPPPARIAIYPSSLNNEWEPSISALEVGDLIDNDVFNPNARYYRIDISSIFRQMVQEKIPLTSGFLIGPMGTSNSGSTYATSLDRLVLPKGSVKLEVYYTTLVDQ